MAVAGGDDGDLIDIRERRRQGSHDFGHVGDELVDDGGLVVFLISLGFDVHRFGLGFAFLQYNFGFGFALRADSGGGAFGFGDAALTFGGGEGLDALAIDFRLLQDGRDQFPFAAENFGFLNFDFVLFFDLSNFHRLGHHLLLHDVGLNVVGFVGLGLLFLGGFQVLRFLDFKIARGLGLLGGGERLGEHSLLIGLGCGDGGGAGGFRAFDDGVALGFGGGDIGVAFDARDVGTAHVGDVVVLVADFLDGEGNNFKAHLAHVIGAGGAHTVADHLRFLDNLFD